MKKKKIMSAVLAEPLCGAAEFSSLYYFQLLGYGELHFAEKVVLFF